MLNPGDKAPNFSLPNQDGNPVSLADFKGKVVLLYFYPKDLTPGCTVEACDARDAVSTESLPEDFVILGVSADKPEMHRKFIKKHGLNFTLLSDTSYEMLQAYGAWGEKKIFGKTTLGIKRITYLIDGHGRILKAYDNVQAKNHIASVVEDYRLIKSKS